MPMIGQSNNARIALSSLIIAAYAVLTAIELRRDRRDPERCACSCGHVADPARRGLSVADPDHAFLSRIGFGQAWFALFALLTLLYVVGTAFIVVVMAKEHAVLVHKTAALTDPLTGLFNRRGFLEAAQKLIEASAARASRSR